MMDKPSKKNISPKVSLENASAWLVMINRYLVWLLLLLAVVILAVGYYFFLGPKFETVRNKNNSFLPDKKEVLTNLIKIENKLITLEQKFNLIQQQKEEELGRLYNLLPTEPDYAALFVQTEFLAKANNLKVSSVDISRTLEQPLSERRTPTPVQANSPTEQTLEILPTNVHSLAVNIQVGEGTYDNFKLYLDDLEKNLRLYDVQTISFESVNPETEMISGFNVNLKTYYLVVNQ